MKDFAFYIQPAELGFYDGVIRNMPPDIIDIHIGPTKAILNDFDSLEPDIRQNIKDLSEKGYGVYPMKHDWLPKYQAVAITSLFMGRNQTVFHWNTMEKIPYMVCLYHDTDSTGGMHPLASAILLQSERQACAKEENKIMRKNSPEIVEQVMSFPRENFFEYAWTGPYHLGEWAKKRHQPKEVIRAEMEEKLGHALPGDKPVIAFFSDEFCNLRQVEEGLRKLAPHASIIIKSSILPHIPGTYLWPDEGLAPNLLRFGADFILTGYHSGTLASSTMLGLNVIPYYTSIVYWGGRILGKVTRHLAYLPSYAIYPHVCQDILDKLNPPLNLLETASILERLNDDAWWRNYKTMLPEAQKNIFGTYDIENAPLNTARLLLRSFVKKSFGKDAGAVRVRPGSWLDKNIT